MIKVFVDCVVNGHKRGSTDYYRGSWDACIEAADVIRGRIRGDISVLENRPGELRIFWEDERESPYLVMIDAVLATDVWVSGVAEILSIEVENSTSTWYPNGASSDNQNNTGEDDGTTD